MSLDFASLVLGPCMGVFSDPIMFTPKVSQPGVAAYPARGVFAQKPAHWQLENGGTESTLETTFGIQLSDYRAPPAQGDSFVRQGTTWFVWDANPDGQGGMSLIIKGQKKKP